MSHLALPSRVVFETIRKETTMTTRMNPYVKHFGLVKPLIDLAKTVQSYGLEETS